MAFIHYPITTTWLNSAKVTLVIRIRQVTLIQQLIPIIKNRQLLINLQLKLVLRYLLKLKACMTEYAEMLEFKPQPTKSTLLLLSEKNSCLRQMPQRMLEAQPMCYLVRRSLLKLPLKLWALMYWLAVN